MKTLPRDLQRIYYEWFYISVLVIAIGCAGLFLFAHSYYVLHPVIWLFLILIGICLGFTALVSFVVTKVKYINEKKK